MNSNWHTDRNTKIFRFVFRAPAVVALFATYMLLAGCLQLFALLGLAKRYDVIWLNRLTGLLLLRIFNFRVSITGIDRLEPSQPALILCNHLSYWDIAIILAHFPTTFITSVEIKHLPVIGQFCRLAGCLFVERRRKSQLHAEINQIRSMLNQGISVVLFPEGTSSNGAGVLPFRKSLIEAAVGSSVKILPLCINYKVVDGSSVSKQNRDKIFWYGDMTFLGHFLHLLGCKDVKVDLFIGESYQPAPEQDRKHLTQWAYGIINAKFNPVT